MRADRHEKGSRLYRDNIKCAEDVAEMIIHLREYMSLDHTAAEINALNDELYRREHGLIKGEDPIASIRKQLHLRDDVKRKIESIPLEKLTTLTKAGTLYLSPHDTIVG